MPLPELPLEILAMIGDHMRDEHGELRYADFNSFQLQVNSALHAYLNRQLWKEASEGDDFGPDHIFTHLISTNNLAGVEFFLSLGANVEVGLPAYEITESDDDPLGFDILAPTPLLVAARRQSPV
jgi:hypothetical protein